MSRDKIEKSDIVIRYKKSITLDYFLIFVLIIVLIISMGILSEVIGVHLKIFYLPIIVFALIQNIAQDFIFHKSIGKRIYKLKIVTNIKTKKKLLKALVMRRFYEATYHPLLNKDFDAISNMIEAVTETKIVDDERLKHTKKLPRNKSKTPNI